MDMGSYVVIVNAEKVTVSGNKFNDKMYRRHTGRPGSLKEETFKKLQAVRRSPHHLSFCWVPFVCQSSKLAEAPLLSQSGSGSSHRCIEAAYPGWAESDVLKPPSPFQLGVSPRHSAGLDMHLWMGCIFLLESYLDSFPNLILKLEKTPYFLR
jgi:hypothetical protein